MEIEQLSIDLSHIFWYNNPESVHYQPISGENQAVDHLYKGRILCVES